MKSYLTAINMQPLAILGLSAVNVWLCVQSVRWLMYSYPMLKLTGKVNIYMSLDPVLEIPGILVGLAMGYMLLWRMGRSIWTIRYSHFRHRLMVRTLSLNSGVLPTLTVLGIAEWLAFYNYLPIDLIVVVSFGVVAIIVAVSLEVWMALKRLGRPTPLVPLSHLESLAQVWAKSSRFSS